MQERGKGRILIVEDEPQIAGIIERRLQSSGYRCEIAGTGTQAMARLGSEQFDLVSLDIMVPGIDGLSICDHLHRKAPGTLLLIVSSLDTREKRLNAYSLGADDFIGKPFSGGELAAKVDALFRRKAITKNDQTRPLNGALRLDDGGKTVSFNGAAVPLTPSEYLIFQTLADNPNLVFSREKLAQILWDQGLELYDDRVIDSHVYHIRKKLGEHHAEYKNIIRTVRGFGYRFGEV